MDKDLYYKYSELWLIKHPTSLLYSGNIVNKLREFDWLIVKWPNDTGQKCGSLREGGARESSAGSESRGSWKHFYWAINLSCILLNWNYQVTLLISVSKRQEEVYGTIKFVALKFFSTLHRMIFLKDSLFFSFKNWTIQLQNSWNFLSVVQVWRGTWLHKKKWFQQQTWVAIWVQLLAV